MAKTRWARLGMMACLAVATTACASAANPWSTHERRTDLKRVAADPGRMCDVVLLNGTERTVEAFVSVPGTPRSLGVLNAGQSLQFGVACSSRRIFAEAISRDLDSAEGIRFRKGALLDLARATEVRLTSADLVRW
jgi:hypothetical protein